MCCRLAARELVKRDIEFYNIDTGFAEKACPTGPSVQLDQVPHSLLTDAAGFGDALNLNFGRGRADLGIQAAARSGDHIDRNLRSLDSSVLFQNDF
jgi:hypothetical protein